MARRAWRMLCRTKVVRSSRNRLGPLGLVFALELAGMLLIGAGCARKDFGDGLGNIRECPLGHVGCACTVEGTCQGSLRCVRGSCLSAQPNNSSAAAPQTSSAPTSTSAPSSTGSSSTQLPPSNTNTQAPPSSTRPDPGQGCDNGLQDSHESDVDCGGDTCPAFALGQRCKSSSDCQTMKCSNSRCVAPDAY